MNQESRSKNQESSKIQYSKFNLHILGFTLVELLVVIAIISILATLILAAFRSSQKRSRDAQRKSDLKEISNALEMFYSDKKLYPASNSSGEIIACPYTAPNFGECSWGEDEMTDGLTTYFRELPKDPISSQSYFYRSLNNQQAYQIYAHLENNEDKGCIKDASGVVSCSNPNIPSGIDCGGTNDICNFAVTSPNVTPAEAGE